MQWAFVITVKVTYDRNHELGLGSMQRWEGFRKPSK